jgi:exosome complex component RRP42
MEPMDEVKTYYIKELLARGKREDNRGMFDFRQIRIKRGVIQHAEGSAQVELGGTVVLAGVKLQIEEPMEDTPKQGNLMVAAELLPLAHADFESGPPSPESIELSRVVDRGIRAAECIDLESLFIEEGKAWTAFIDLYILNHDGNLLDASSIAAMAAIMDTKMPRYDAEKKVADYTVKTEPLKVKNIVVSTTFGKVGSTIVLDTNMHEENSMDTRLTIETDGKAVRAIQKGLHGSFSVKEIESLVDVAFNKYNEVKSILEH